MGNYIEHSLGREEELVYKAKVHWASLLPSAFCSFFGIGIPFLILAIIRIMTTNLGFTNKRLLGKVGLINTKSLDSPLNKVNNVSISSGLFGKILGYGTIDIVTSSGGGYSFKCIAQPNSFRQALMAQIEAYDEHKIKKQAAEMASAIKESRPVLETAPE